jgi:hypothetical protein
MEHEEEVISAMMETSHERISISDIWAVIVFNISVFQYNNTLATWFFGFNVVRFEHLAK